MPSASRGEQRKWWFPGPHRAPWLSSRWKASKQERRVQFPQPLSKASTGCRKMGVALFPRTRVAGELSVHTGSGRDQDNTETWTPDPRTPDP